MSETRTAVPIDGVPAQYRSFASSTSRSAAISATR